MGLKKAILTWMLQIFNLFRFLMPVRKNRITFISLTSDHLEQDFAAIDQLLKKDAQYDIHYNLILFKKTLKDDFLYMLNCFKQLYEINTSRLVILNDNNFVVTKFKRPSTYVIQTWHACGAVKKFGNQIVRQYPVKNYDCVLSNSPYWKHAYAQAFGVKEEQILVSGMPRVDKLNDHKVIQDYQEAFDLHYPALKDAYKILYAPTFRGNIIDGLYYDEIDFDSILSRLPSDYVILYKMHPLMKDVSLGEHERFVNVSHEDLYTLLCACDCLVSDYSSILFDYSLLHKKAICYSSDYEAYEQSIGFNVKYKNEMPSTICTNEEELLTQLMDPAFDEKRMLAFQKRFMPFTDGNNAQRVVAHIHTIMN